jgi:hypothetical protein
MHRNYKDIFVIVLELNGVWWCHSLDLQLGADLYGCYQIQILYKGTIAESEYLGVVLFPSAVHMFGMNPDTCTVYS